MALRMPVVTSVVWSVIAPIISGTNNYSRSRTIVSRAVVGNRLGVNRTTRPATYHSNENGNKDN